MEVNQVNIRTRNTLYKEVYSNILKETMGANSPYQKAVNLLDDFFVKFKIPENLKCQTMSGILTAMCQSVVSTSQSIALQLVLESDRIELEAKKMEKEIELIDAQKAKLAKEGDLITAQIALSGAEKAKIEAETTLLPKQLLKLEKEAELIANQKELALAEKNLTSERIKLVTAQTSAELAKKPLIEREKAVYDDNLRVKEAVSLKI